MKKISIISFIAVILSGCLKDDSLNIPFESFKPKEIHDGHVISCPSAESMDSSALLKIYRDAYHDNNLWPLRSLLVFRNGKLVSEAYFKDEKDITTRHLIWSCTKQVMGILAGIALDQGLITDADDPISDYLDVELAGHSDKADITIRNLLTMQSGIKYNDDGANGESSKLLRQIPDNCIEFILSLPTDATPGSNFHYNDGNAYLLSAILKKVTGEYTDVWADEVLFSRLEMTNYYWARYKDGITMGGHGIETTPRELSKIALCVSDSGQWKNQQIIKSQWINEMLTPRVYDEVAGFSFGYFWWIDTARNIKFMWGVGGQLAFIVPEKNIVVVMTSFANTGDDYQIRPEEALPYVDRIIHTTD